MSTLRSLLPPINSRGYFLLLGAVAILILGPLGGITAAYMNFSLGFFVGGQVLAGILGSVVTYGYGAEGKHGANYMQTMAASVAGLMGLAVLIQAMTWLGLPEPPVWKLVLYFLSIGMFGVGVGMLYTPLLVDRMRLSFPSGYAVANILRALTDIRVLKRSVTTLGGGIAVGIATSLGANFDPRIAASGFTPSTFGAGIIVGARIGVPAIVVATIGHFMTPWLRANGWLDPNAPFRKIGFILALGTIMGAAAVDMAMLAGTAIKQIGQARNAAPVEDWKKTDQRMLYTWVAFWGAMVFAVGVFALHLPANFVLIALGLVFIFLLVNGISLGISDSNPISSAFVLTVFILAACGLTDPITGLLCAAILLISTSVGGDMQQDRSTGWRLGTPRTIQFYFQTIGITMGAIMSVVIARLFMKAYPVLAVNQYDNPGTPGAEKWQSAMTFKFVGALEGITHRNPHIMEALAIGIGLGLLTEILRKLIKLNTAYKAWVKAGKTGYTTDLMLDCVFLPSPYASSFGGFVEFGTALWFGLGGVLASVLQTIDARRPKKASDLDLPEDMSTLSLVGGGLIAGDSLAALGLGIYGLLQTVIK